MQLLRDNPVTTLYFAFFLSACAFSYIPISLRLMLALMGIILFLWLTAKGRKPDNLAVRLLCIGVTAASLLTSAAELYAQRLEQRADSEAEVTLRILDTEYQMSYGAGYIAQVLQSDTLPKYTRIRLYSPLTALPTGSILSGTVELQSHDTTDSTFPARRYYLPKRVFLQAEDLTLSHVDTRPLLSPSAIFRRINEKLTAMLLAHTSTEAGGLASAVLLGNRDALDDSTQRDFRRLGITHLLVVSGTHFSVLIALSEGGMKKLGLRPRSRCGISMILIVFFMLLTGLSPSVVRAGIMNLIAQLSRLLMRRNNLIHAFAFSGAVMVLFNPYCAMDCGLQLSFAATCCCIMFQIYKGSFYRLIRRKTGIALHKMPLIGILETIGCTSFVSLGTLPLLWLYFGQISLFSLPANLLFTPLISILMLLSLVYLCLFPLKLLIPPFSALLNLFCCGLCAIAELLAKPNWILLPVNYPFSVFFLLPLTGILLLIPFFRRQNKLRLMTASLAVSLCFFALIGIVELSERSRIRFSYVPYKNHDGFVLKAGGKILLAEISDASYGYANRLTQEMAELHGCEIDTLLITHYHNKHIQLINRLSQREMLTHLVLPEPINDRENTIYRGLTELADLEGIHVVTVPQGECYVFEGIEIALHERSYLSRSTHPVTGITLDFGEEELTLTTASFTEGAGSIRTAAEESEYVILGCHSPKTKKTVSLSFETEPKVLAVREEVFAFLDDTTASEAVSLTQTPLRISINPNES